MRAASVERVLIVDDNVDMTELLSAYLEALGHETAVAHDGASCLEAVRTFAPTVVLLDIGLPILDGYSVASLLREKYGRGLRLIATTGYGQQSDRVRGIEAGFDDYLVKPLDLELVAMLVRQPEHARAG